MQPPAVPAWIDVQANPERASFVGNTERVAYGYTEIEGGGNLLLGLDPRVVTPVRLKLALLPNFELDLGTEGAIFTVAGQRAAGVFAGGRTVVFKDPESSLPDLALRGSFTSPFPTPAAEVGRMRTEAVLGKRLNRDFRWDVSLGADFSANLGAAPLVGAAVQAWVLYPFGFMAETKLEGANLAAGATMLYTMTPREIVDIGAFYHLDGSIDVRFGITRTLPLPWPVLLPLVPPPAALPDLPYQGGQTALPEYPAGSIRVVPEFMARPEAPLPDFPAGPAVTLPDYPAGSARTLPDYPSGSARALPDFPAAGTNPLRDFPLPARAPLPDFPYGRHEEDAAPLPDGAR